MDALGSIVDRLQGLFGKGFLVAGLLPVTIFAALNLGMALLVSAEVRDFVPIVWEQPAVALLMGAGVVLAISLAGFVIWILNPVVRLVLHGRVPLVGAFLRVGQRQQFDAEESSLDSARNRLVPFLVALQDDPVRPDERAKVWRLRLVDAAARGANETTALPPADAKSVEDAIRALVAGSSDCAAYDAVCTRLEHLIGRYPAERFRVLYQLWDRFLDAAVQRRAALEAALRPLELRRHQRWPTDSNDIGPTEMANVWQADLDYAWDRYSIAVDTFWPQLQKVIASDATYQPVFDEAAVKLSFATSMTVLFGALTVLWLVALPNLTDGALFYFGSIAAACGGTWLFYRSTRQASIDYGTTLRSAIDLYRFGVLGQLHLPLPADSDEERAMWLVMTRLAERTGSDVVEYDHGDSQPNTDSARPHVSRWRRVVAALFD